MAGDLREAKRYSNTKYALSIIETIYLLALLFVFLASGASLALVQVLRGKLTLGYLLLPAYLLTAFLLYYLVSFPLNFYHSYILEKKFALSKQSVANWCVDQLKSGAISYIIFLILLVSFYKVLSAFGNNWWIVISLIWIFFSLVLAKLAPVVIIPLFFKYKKLTDESLRNRILALAQKMRIKVLDCFEIDLSKKTLKANAAFTGLGNTRRVLLADTLKDKYTEDEIEVILAHEFAHYRLKHIWKLVVINSAATMFSFYLIFLTSQRFLNMFGFSDLSMLAALPVVVIYFTIIGFVLEPVGNYFSRRMEINADLMAISVTGNKEAFVTLMNKLSAQNLSDRNPHLLIKWFFFDHPPIDERIKLVNKS